MPSSSLRVASALAVLACACGDDGGSGAGGGSTSSSKSGPATTVAASTSGSTTSGSTASVGGGGPGGSGAGGEDPWAGPLVHLAELDLGTTDIGEPIVFPIPDRTIGLTTFSTTAESGLIGILQLRPPNSSSVVVDLEIPGTNAPVFAGESLITAANPQSDLPEAWPVLEGNWRLRLAADGPMAAESSVFVRRTSDGAFHGGVIDINVLVAPSSGVDAAYLNPVIDQVFSEYWGPDIGLSKGTVTFLSLSDTYANVGSEDELAEMFATSAGIGPAPALNLFVIADFSFSSAIGIAGGIPGTPMMHGTRRSGVAYTPSGNQGYDASVVAHEMGHLAGLFHTTELMLDIFDPLGDTATCPNIEGNPGACPDTSNVMFPIATGSGTFSPLQARVVQGSAMYRGILEEGGLPGSPLPSIFPIAAREAPSQLLYRLPLDTSRAPASTLERMLDAPVCDLFADADEHLLKAVQPTGPDLEAAALRAELSDRARARALRLLARTSAPQATAIAASLLGTGAGRRVDMAAIALLDEHAPSLLAELADARAPFSDPAVVLRLDELGCAAR